MADPRVAKLADLLVNYSLQLSPSQIVRIDAGTVAAPLATERCDLRRDGEVSADRELVWKAGRFLQAPSPVAREPVAT